MKCFMHPYQEAISVCKRCGKAMCVDCSSYSGHSGICPQCKRVDYIKERDELQIQYNQLAGIKTPFNINIVWAALLAVLVVVIAIVTKMSFLFVLLVIPAYFGIKAIMYKTKTDRLSKDRLGRMRVLWTRIEYLNGEIDKLESALRKGDGII